jgi:large subunit ribosomal protein L30
MALLEVTYCKSAIGYSRVQKDTIRKLGLRRLHQTVSHEDSPAVRGMVARVSHLVEVREVEA